MSDNLLKNEAKTKGVYMNIEGVLTWYCTKCLGANSDIIIRCEIRK